MSSLVVITRTATATKAWILLINVRMNSLKSSTCRILVARPGIGICKAGALKLGGEGCLVTGLLEQTKKIVMVGE